MPISVRDANPTDALAIATAHVNAWRRAYRGLMPDAVLDDLDVDDRAELWRSILEGEVVADGGPPPLNVVAEIDDQPGSSHVVGFAAVGFFRADTDDVAAGELWAMYVDPASWDRGAGHALMVRTLGELRRIGATTGYLWVLDGNERAQRFYERHGWLDDGVTKTEEIGGAQVVERRYSCSVPFAGET